MSVDTEKKLSTSPTKHNCEKTINILIFQKEVNCKNQMKEIESPKRRVNYETN